MQSVSHYSTKIHNSFFFLNSFFEQLPILTMVRSPLPPAMVYVHANIFKTVASLTETCIALDSENLQFPYFLKPIAFQCHSNFSNICASW